MLFNNSAIPSEKGFYKITVQVPYVVQGLGEKAIEKYREIVKKIVQHNEEFIDPDDMVNVPMQTDSPYNNTRSDLYFTLVYRSRKT